MHSYRVMKEAVIWTFMVISCVVTPSLSIEDYSAGNRGNNVANSDIPDGVAPGDIPPGAVPPGAVPPGAVPAGGIPPGDVPQGVGANYPNYGGYNYDGNYADYYDYDGAGAVGNPSDYVQPQNNPIPVAANSGKPCTIYPYDPETSARVASLLRKGMKLIRYNLYFQDYPAEYDPLKGNFSRNYKLNEWERVTSEHGSTLLSLTFNFDVLSLWLLTVDVEELDIALVDTHNCMQYLNEEQRFQIIRDLLIKDFIVENGNSEKAEPFTDGHALCHQVILKDKDKYANFTYECCHHDLKLNTVCHTDTHNKWVDIMFGVFAAVKVLILFFGPMMVQRWILTEPINKVDYVVPLRPEDNLKKTMLVKKVLLEDDSLMSSPHQQREMKQFRKFRRLVKDIPSDEIVSVNFHKLHLLVDHDKLMSEKVIPLGIFHYIYAKVLRCGICSVEPFASCCKESILGTWGPKFLWIKMFEKSECNTSFRRYLSWGRIARIIGYLLTMAILPLPYIFRSVCFYLYEEDEMEDRNDALERLDLNPQLSHNLFQYITPTHGGLITMYIIYVATFLFLSCLRQCDKVSCDDHICGAIQDMRGISYLECLRMLSAHIVLPFEKFGICGCLAAALYWPFALPICALVLACYCVPTLYLSGRLLLHGRPSCLHLCPVKSTSRGQKTLSDGTSSFENCLFLNNINPTGPQIESPSKRQDDQSYCGFSQQSLSQATYTLLVGGLTILQMYALLIMYAESIGFIIEGCMMTVLGAIINATNTIRYVLLVFWIVLYCAYCYRSVYKKYSRLNKKVFEYIKDAMFDQLQRCVTMRHDQHKNTAVKFLTRTDIRQKERFATIYFDSEEDLPSVRPKEKNQSKTQNLYLDMIDYRHGHLHWTVHGLILFVDRRDIPRIPRDLFHQICELEAPGCPGPIHKTLGRAVKQLALIIIFLLLMFLLVMILEDIAPISTTSELLIMLATGFLPLILLFVLKYPEEEISLNNYSFTGKVQQVIMAYKATWPVYDLSFTRNYHGHGGGEVSGGDDDVTPPSQASTLQIRRPVPETGSVGQLTGPDVVDPTHVDLLITIKDEIDLDCVIGNLRSEPCSLGSHGSLNSGHRNSPDDPGSGNGGATGGAYSALGAVGGHGTNKPTNATASRALEKSHKRTGSNSGTPTQTAAWGPGSPKVNLVVDIAKGGCNVRGQNTQPEMCPNGIPMWPVEDSKYSQVNEKQPESSL